MVDNAILEEKVVSREWESPCSSRRSEERHWDAETNFGSHA